MGEAMGRFSAIGKSFLLAASAAILVSFPAAASLITYTLSDATVTFSGPPTTTADLSGTVTFNTTSDTITNVDITTTGGSPPLDSNTDHFAGIFMSISSSSSFASNDGGMTNLFMKFANPLNPLSNAPDPISEIQFSNTVSIFATNSFTGSVIPPSAPIQEPSALALLGTTLAGLFLFGFRAHHRHDRQGGNA
jgi:hypothetical protein